jgi:hypothetical protein
VQAQYPAAQPGDGLSIAQQKALEALIHNAADAAAAAECGVSKRTLFRWLKEPGFQNAHRMLQNAFVTQAHAGLNGITADAVETLRELMNDRNAPAGARVSACRATLTLAYELIQAEEIQWRLERLEKLKASRGEMPY